MPWQNHQKKPADTSIQNAFRHSLTLATKWNDFINRQCGLASYDFMKTIDEPGIRANALIFTPFVWAARRLRKI